MGRASGRYLRGMSTHTSTVQTYCSRCETTLEAGVRFCSFCGTAVDAEREAARVHPRTSQEFLLERVRQATAGEFDIISELGRGGMATVYLAHDVPLDRKVAIKVMSPDLYIQGDNAERFKRYVLRNGRRCRTRSSSNITRVLTRTGSACDGW